MFRGEDTDRSNAGGRSPQEGRWLPRLETAHRDRAIARWEGEGGRVANNNSEADAPSLSQQKLRRLKALIVRHRALEAAVRLEFQSPRPDQDHLQRLKRARLRVKDEILSLQET